MYKKIMGLFTGLILLINLPVLIKAEALDFETEIILNETEDLNTTLLSQSEDLWGEPETEIMLEMIEEIEPVELFQTGEDSLYSGSCGENAEYFFDSDTGVLVISGSGATQTCMVLPNTQPDQPWYEFRNSINKVIIEEGITAIGRDNFSGCKNISEAELPDSLIKIGQGAFDECRSLTKINLPENLEEISYGAFYRCDSLGSISLPDSLKVIRGEAFQYCKSLEKLELPENLNSIGYQAFCGCEKLIEIVIPDSVTEIGDKAFWACVSLESITFPKNITVLPKQICEFDFLLQNVSLPDKLSEIGEYAFAGCGSLEKLILPDEVVQIKAGAFAFAPKLQLIDSWGVGELSPEAFTDDYDNLYFRFLQSGENAFVAQLPDQEHGETLAVHGLGDSAFSDFANENEFCHFAAYDYTDNYELVYKTPVYENEFTIERFSFDGYALEKDTDYEIIVSQNLTGTTVEVQGKGRYNTFSTTIIPEAKEKTEAGFTVDQLSYSFGNDYYDYGYPYPYRIPLRRYEEMIRGDDGSPSALARQYYERCSEWGGNCYGMSSTSAMFLNSAYGINISDFRSDAGRISELHVQDTSTAMGCPLSVFIERMHVTQYIPAITKKVAKNMNKLDQLVEAVRTEKEPVMLIFNKGTSGHAVLGCYVEDIDSNTSYLHIYDCNYPEKDCYIVLKKNGKGNYQGWSYKISDTEYGVWSTENGALLSFLLYDTYSSKWNAQNLVSYDTNLMVLGSSNVVIRSSDNDIVATIENGILHSTREDIVQLPMFSSGNNEAESDPAIYLPSGEIYTVENKAEEEVFEVTLTNVCLTEKVITDAGNVTLGVNDKDAFSYVSVDAGKGEQFSIEMTSYKNNDKFKVFEASGIGDGSQVEIERKSNNLFVDCNSGKFAFNGKTYEQIEIQTEAGDGGKISPAGKVISAIGKTKEFQIIPDADYEILDVIVDGISQGAVPSYTFEKPGCDHTISAVFQYRGCSHIFDSWQIKEKATVFQAEKQTRVCSRCGIEEERIEGTPLSPTMKINVTKLSLKVKQFFSGIQVTDLARGDEIVSWESSRPQVVSVTNQGKITGKKTGTAKIRITLASGISKTVQVNVQKKPVATKKIAGIPAKLVLTKGETVVLRPVLQPLTSQQKLTFSSSHPRIVSVTKKGIVRAKSKGTVTVTVKSGSKSRKIKIKVN